MKRIIVVYNLRSSSYKKIKTEVLNKLRELKGALVGKYEVVPTNFEDNVNHLAKILAAKDLVLAVGGDATAAIAANAVIKKMADDDLSGDERPALAVLPYGNFNDFSKTLGTKKLKDVMGALDKNTGDFKLKTVDFWPLEVSVDGKHFRYATCYVTAGMMAEATKLFDKPQVRAELQKGSYVWLRHIRSYWRLAKWYFKNRKKEFLPEFELNGKVVKKATDYIATNGASMAGIMKTRNNGLSADFFENNTFFLGFFGNLLGFMAKSILFFTPVKKTFGDVLEFKKPTDIEMQIEGEYKKFVQVKKITINKSKQPIKGVIN